MEDFLDIELKSEVFEPGEVLGGDVESDNLNIRIGKRPVARNLRKLYELENRELPPEFAIFRNYGIWIITTSVGIVDEKGEGNDRLKHFGFKVRFDEYDPITIIDVLPKSKFVERVAGKLNIVADLKANGQFSLPESGQAISEKPIPVDYGAEGKLGVDANVVARFNFGVVTPVITAIGEEDVIGQWQFTREDKPMVGMQKMIMTILTPPDEEMEGEEITFEGMVTASIKRSLFHLPDKRKSEWVSLSCTLG